MTPDDRPEASDPLWDIRPRAMAARFGGVARRRIRAGLDCRESATLAAHFAGQVLAQEAGQVVVFGRPRGGRFPDGGHR